MDRCDVVVVGGGIAGSALAVAVARAGLAVTVLERQITYRDRVRGEYLAPWGAAEAHALEVDDALLGTDAAWITHAVPYDELLPPEFAEANLVSLGDLRPDAPGALDVGHPDACQALAEAAEAAGAVFVRGIGEVEVRAGCTPSVRFELDDLEHEISCRVVVGADGRASTVRRQLGMPFVQTKPRTMVAGLLVEGLDDWPVDRMALGTEDDLHYFVFPRHGGTARLYQIFDVAQRGRFTGPARDREMLDSFRLRCLPIGEQVAKATPAGPVATYPDNDSLVDSPCVPGVVLIGDAAGWNDPIIGQGLSIALRDARRVAATITASEDWSPDAFSGYVAERRERMRRLRLCAELETDLRCGFTPAGRQHRLARLTTMHEDPLAAAATIVTAVAGPDVAPPEAFTAENIARIKAIA